jgi:beta-galactosidase
MRTAGHPSQLRLTPDRTALDATGDDLCYLLVEALDKEGVLCPLADNLATFSVDGPAEIVAVGNGNPMSLEPFQADRRHLFHGKAMLIIRTQHGRAGLIRLRAASEGLVAGEATCTSQITERAVPNSSE